MRWRALVGVLAIVAAACGGGDTGAVSPGLVEDPDAQIEIDDEVVRVATTIVEHLGDDGGIEALLFALERGYSIDQLLSIGSDGRALDGVGVITGPAGVVDPEIGLLGLIELPDGPNAMGAPVGVLAAYRSSGTVAGVTTGGVAGGDVESFEIEHLRNHAQNLADTYSGSTSEEVQDQITVGAVGLILLWATNGYSGEQIIEALALGGRSSFVPTDNVDYCMLLLVADEVIIPASRPHRKPACLDEIVDLYGDQSASTTTSAASDGEPPPSGDATGGPGALSGRFDPAYLATFASAVEVNTMVVDLTGDVPVLSLALRFTSIADRYDNDPDVLCQPLGVLEGNGPLESGSFADDIWTGTLIVSFGTFDGNCSAGSQEGIMETTEVPITINISTLPATGTVVFGQQFVFPFSVDQ